MSSVGVNKGRRWGTGTRPSVVIALPPESPLLPAPLLLFSAAVPPPPTHTTAGPWTLLPGQTLPPSQGIWFEVSWPSGRIPR